MGRKLWAASKLVVLNLLIIGLGFAATPAKVLAVGGGVRLQLPFQGIYRMTAYFDHESPNYGDNNYIRIYNGEQVAATTLSEGATGEPYPYDGHNGIDWGMVQGTNVLAAASGEVVYSGWKYGETIVLEHENEHFTFYGHLSQRLVNVGDNVSVGQHIGESGDTGSPGSYHLHFSVFHMLEPYTNLNVLLTHAVDPFGWRGLGRDPLYNYNQEESVCLWAGVPGDDISCSDIIIEDDGSGWDQDGWWYESTAGNGYRQHWTNVWAQRSAWVRWSPFNYYPGYYQIYAFIPASNSTTTHADYEVYTYPNTVHRFVNQNNPANTNFWASLGVHRFVGTDWVYLDDHTGEAQGSRTIAADSMKFTASIVYLPDIVTNNGKVSSIIVRNNKSVAAQVQINYYNSSGGRVADLTETVPGRGIMAKVLYGFSGSAIVVASQDVVVVVKQNGGQEQSAYTGIKSSGGDPGWEVVATDLYVPYVYNNYYGYTSALRVFNPSSSTANVTVNYYVAAGQFSQAKTYSVSLNSSVTFSPGAAGVGNNFYGSAYIDANQPVVVLADAYNTNIDFSIQAGTGATTAYLPYIMRQYYGWDSCIGVRNVSGSSNTVKVTYYWSGGQYIETHTLSGNALKMLCQGNNPHLPAGSLSAKIESLSNRPVVVGINQSHNTAGKHMSYNAASQPSQTAIIPYVLRNAYANGGWWSSGFQVQNVGSVNTCLTIKYYNSSGTVVKTDNSNCLGPGRALGVYLPNVSGLANGQYSVAVTASQPLVAVGNATCTSCSGDNVYAFNGVNR